MFHLLIAEKHRQLLLKNVEACPVREVYATAHVARKFYAIALTLSNVHVVDASR